MADIFVSYSTADRSRVSVLAEELQQRGWSVWWDREIVVGTAWDDAIEQEIAKARCVLVLWSPNSVKSEWVKNEARDAKQRHILVPALIEATKLPIEFRHIQTADLTSWTPGEPNPEFEKLLAGLHQLLDGLKKPEISEDDKPTQTMVGEVEEQIPAGLSAQKKTGEKPKRGDFRSWGSRRSALRWTGMAGIALGAAALVWWNSTATAPSGAAPAITGAAPTATAPAATLQLVSPAPDATVLGSLVFSWSAKDLNQTNLQFELWVKDATRPPLITRLTRNSYRLNNLVGPLRWKVRPVWRESDDAEKYGEWTEERTLTFYPSALDRILRTRTIHVGIGEEEGIYVRTENGRMTGFDIELLRKIGAALLEANQIPGEIKIDSTYRVWGDKYFRLLDEEPTVDLLASGISITPERQKEYGLVFSRPILRYPQTVVTAWGDQPFTDGKLVLSRLGVAEKTTSEELGKHLIGSSNTQLIAYNGSGAYDSMFRDLLAQKIQGILLDKPYALQQIGAFGKDHSTANFVMADVDDKIFANVEAEQIGWAVRSFDRPLLNEINKQLQQQEHSRTELIKKFFPNPEAFLPE